MLKALPNRNAGSPPLGCGPRLASVALVAFAMAASAPVSAQVFPFQILVQDGSLGVNLANNGNYPVTASDIGQTVNLSFVLTYRGQSTITIQSAPDLIGSADFSLTGFPEVPLKLTPAQQVRFSVAFTPRNSRASSAQLNMVYVEAPGANAPVGSLATVGAVTVNLLGTTPDFVVSYIIPADGNFVPLAPGGQIPLPPVLVDGLSTAIVSVVNRGSGFGSINSISVTGAGFQPFGIPLLPGDLGPGQEFRFSIRYRPTVAGPATGELTLGLGAKTLSYKLDSQGTAPRFVYESLTTEPPTELESGGTVNFGESLIGETLTTVFRVRNDGDGDGVVSSVVVTGTGFILAEAVSGPITIKPKGVVLITVNYTPTQAGVQRGRLRIGNAAIELVGSGLGSRLTFGYSNSAGNTPILSGGAVNLSPTEVGQNSTVIFTVRNAGTSPATIANIAIGETGAFSVTGLPRLPLSLDPQAEASFVLRFAPLQPGLLTASLRVENALFTVSGSSTRPPALPGFRFVTGASVVEALSQPTVGLELNAPYPVTVTGTLTAIPRPLSFIADPSVQFASGGRVVTFQIPAGTTRAVFPNSTNTIRIQSGSVAGDIALVPTFATQAGFDLSPQPAQPQVFTILPNAPRLIGVEIVAKTTTSFALRITGLSSTRNLKGLTFKFTPSQGYKIEKTDFAIDIGLESELWFRSAASETFGGQFAVIIPFDFRDPAKKDPPSPTPPGDTGINLGLENVVVTVSNAVGPSSELTLSLR